MTTVRFALVGSARQASPWLLRSLSRVGSFEAICDSETEQPGVRHGARWTFPELADMLREAEPQVVVLLRPVVERPRIIKECLAAGASVLTLGPPGLASSCNRIGTLAKLANRVVFASPPILFSPAMLLARRLVESGKIGAPISMTMQSRRQADPGAGQERQVVPIDQVYEAVSLIYQLIGPIRQVQAIDHPEGVLAALAETASGVPVSIMCHRIRTAEEAGLELELRAVDGTVLRIGGGLDLFCGAESRVEARRAVSLAACDPAVELGYEGLISEFSRCVEAGRGGWEMPAAGPQVTAAAEAVLTAAARRRPVTLKPLETAAKAP